MFVCMLCSCVSINSIVVPDHYAAIPVDIIPVAPYPVIVPIVHNIAVANYTIVFAIDYVLFALDFVALVGW